MFFLNPFILLFLLFPLGFFIRSFTKLNDPFQNFMTKEIREKLFLSVQTFSSKSKYYLFLLTVVLFIFALARPVKVLPSLDVTQNRPSVILAIDMSQSMKKTDIFPSRWELAKTKAQIFIQKAINYNIGVIFYANNAYMLYPISQENNLLLDLMKDSNITQKFSKSTNLFSALEASNFLLKNHQNKHIILFSDGGMDVSRKQELSYLKSKKIILSTLAITPQKNHSIQILSTQSLGLYQPFKWSDEDVSKLIRHIQNTKKSSQKIHHQLSQYQEYFTYPLMLALILLIILFFPLEKITFIFLLIYIQPPSLHAGIFDFWYIHQAQKSSKEKNYSQAIKYYEYIKPSRKIHYNLAYTLYQNEQYNKAIKYYSKALGLNKKMDAKIYYNIATAYAKQHKLDFAKEFYTKSFVLYPTKVAQENLHIITIALKKQRKNLHKKYEKLHFKAIGNNEFSQSNAFSNYAIKIHNFIPSEEEKWFQKISKHKFPTYLQKIKTHNRSIDANISW